MKPTTDDIKNTNYPVQLSYTKYRGDEQHLSVSVTWHNNDYAEAQDIEDGLVQLLANLSSEGAEIAEAIKASE